MDNKTGTTSEKSRTETTHTFGAPEFQFSNGSRIALFF
jgi:hypothetical protein